jgi:hypothetical protein
MPAHSDSIAKDSIARSAPPPDSLQPYAPSPAKPWNAHRVAHLYRRLGFGASLQQIQQGLLLSPTALVDQLLDNAAELGTPDVPFWGNWTSEDYPDFETVFQHRTELRRRWLGEMLEEGVRAKMALFWHNHFVTELDVYDCNAYLWNYFSLLHEYAFGNFRVFVREIGKSGAMLLYLNGNTNVAAEPNENYARELMELFTMGEGNGYTQADIVEMSRALTGWQANNNYNCEAPFYNPALHDNQAKTIFGQTSNYSFTTAHNLIFSARADQVANYIVTKIYKHFVYQQPDPAVVAELAQTFKSSNWELLPMLKQLFRSEHFFEEKFINAQMKSPLESMLCLLKSAGATTAELEDDWMDAVNYWAYQLGQDLFDPPNVAGWKGQRSWVNESTLVTRWNYSSITAYFLTQNDTIRENLRNIALTLSNESNNPGVIVPLLVEHFTGQMLDPIYLQAAIVNFKAGIPENYFQDGSWNLYWDEAPDQVVNLLYFLVRMPEFQLT